MHVESNIPGIELLEEEDQGSSDEDIDGDDSQGDDSVDLVEEDGRGESDGGGSIGSVDELVDGNDESGEDDEDSDGDDIDYSVDGASEISDEESEVDDLLETNNSIGQEADTDSIKPKQKKRKFSDFEGQLNASNNSLRALKKLAGNATSSSNDGILSNEDFQRIRELKVCAS